MAGNGSGAGSLCSELLTDIRHGRLRPGDHLPSEHEIMERFGVSRSMVRDAFAMLAGMGVLDRSRGRRGVIQRVDGSSISRLFPLMLELSGAESARDVSELRILIESEAAAKACLRADQGTRDAIYETAVEYSHSQRKRRYGPERVGEERFIALDTELHRAIASASGNPMFERLLHALTSFLSYAQVQTCRHDRKRSEQAAAEHMRIATAIRDGESDDARMWMRQHLLISAEALERELQSER